jgi:hypothetical protein
LGNIDTPDDVTFHGILAKHLYARHTKPVVEAMGPEELKQHLRQALTQTYEDLDASFGASDGIDYKAMGDLVTHWIDGL